MAKLKENLDHINFKDPFTIELLHLSAYAADIIKDVQNCRWERQYGNGHMTHMELSCVRHPLLLTERGYNNNQAQICRWMCTHKIIKVIGEITYNTYRKESVVEYALVDKKKSREVALTFMKKPPKNMYRTACDHQLGVPVDTTAPEYVTYIAEHKEEFEEVEKGMFRHIDQHESAVRMQARAFIKEHMGSAFVDFLKGIKGEDLLEVNIKRIIELLKINSPVLINTGRFQAIAKFALKNMDVLDYDYLYKKK